MNAQVVAALLLAASAAGESPADWSRFRGPNGSGVGCPECTHGVRPDKNLLWKLELPQGHSSPILLGDRLYVTGLRAGLLVTIAVDRATGRVLWSAPPRGEDERR